MAILVGIRFVCDTCGASFPYETTPAVSRADVIAEARRLAEGEGWRVARKRIDPARAYPEAIMWDTMDVDICCLKCRTRMEGDDELDSEVRALNEAMAEVNARLKTFLEKRCQR